MNRRAIVRISLMVGFFVFISAAGAAIRPAMGQSCKTTTDAQIVANIYAEISKDGKLAGQTSHINVVSVFQAVKLQGWTDSQKDYDNLVEIVLQTNCVRLLNVNLIEAVPPSSDNFMRSSNGCGPGTRECGDVCIPEGDSCNIKG